MLQNLFALSLGALFLFQASPTPVSTVNSTENKTAQTELSPELKEKSLELLTSVATEAQQFSEPSNRIRATMQIADLQWQHDEPKARTLYQNALNDLQSLFATLSSNLSEDEAAEQITLEYTLSALRRDFLLSYAVHDANSALAALQSLKTPTTGKYDALSTDGLELQIASAATKQNPTRAYEIARGKLQEGYTTSFNETLTSLYNTNPENGAKLARDIFSKIKSSKMITDEEQAEIAAAPQKAGQITLVFSDLPSFLQTVSTLNRSALRNKDKKQVPAFSEDEMKELSTFVAQKFLARKDDSPYAIGTVSKAIAKYAPGYDAQIRQRLGANVKEYDNIAEYTGLYDVRSEKSVDEMVSEADELSDPNVRDSIYVQAVAKAITDNEAEKARQIAAKISNKDQQKYAVSQIDEAMPLIKARKGDLGEVRKLLTTNKKSDERIKVLTELAMFLAEKPDKESKENALKLVDEASQSLKGRVRHKTDLDATMQVAAAYAKVQPERAFTLIENSISQMNDLITAGIAVNDFYQQGALKNEELDFEVMQSQSTIHVAKSVEMMKALAAIDFERATGLADRFARPEVRILTKLKLAQSLLDPNALEKEQKEFVRQSEMEIGH